MTTFLKDFQRYRRLVYLNKGIFLLTAVLTITGAVAAGYLIPKKFEAKTTIFIERNVITDLVKGIAITPSMQAKINNLAVSLTSRNLLLQIIKQLDKDLTFKSKPEEESYIRDLQQRIIVDLNEKQGVIIIRFIDTNPIFARDFVNTMARVYIEQNTSTKREESTDATKFLAQQIETFKKRLDVADEAINKFKSEKGLILSSDGTYIRSEIKEAEQKLEELAIRRTELEAQLERLSLHKNVSGRPRGVVAQREEELNRLLSKYTEKHPKVIRAREALQAARNAPSAPATQHGDPTLEQTRDQVQLKLDTTKAMQDHQLKIIEDSKAALREMPLVKAALNELLEKKEQEANIYNQLVNRYGQSEVSKQMELNDKSTIFRVVDPAVTPTVPISPNRPAVILAGIALGLCAGFVAVFLADRFNHSIRSLQELKTLSIPVLAVIPQMTNAVDEKRQSRRDILLVSLGGCYLILVLGVLAMESLKALGIQTAWLQHLSQRIHIF